MSSENSLHVPPMIRKLIEADDSEISHWYMSRIETYMDILRTLLGEASKVHERFVDRNRDDYDKAFPRITSGDIADFIEVPTINFTDYVSQHDFDGDARSGRVMSQYTDRYLLRLIDYHQGRWCAELMLKKLQEDNENLHIDILDYFELCCLNLFRHNYWHFERFIYRNSDKSPSFASTTYRLYRLVRRIKHDANSGNEPSATALAQACMTYHQMVLLTTERSTLYKTGKTPAVGDKPTRKGRYTEEDVKRALDAASAYVARQLKNNPNSKPTINAVALHLVDKIIADDGKPFGKRKLNDWIRDSGLVKK